MPRKSQCPPIFNHLVSFSLSDLKKAGYVENIAYRCGVINIRSKHGNSYSLWIGVSTVSGNSFIELDYTIDGKAVNYKINLYSKETNLNKGRIWYMRCPITGAGCRKIYLYQNHFVGRQAIDGGYYQGGVESGIRRERRRDIARWHRECQIIKDSLVHTFKHTYKGIVTKRYQKVLNVMEENFTLSL
ncbi:hypothetical protein MD537_09695 [Flavihumibacter sediminis]|nr:hypothetical protein [Flavihumibacter sediminis]